MKAQTVLEIPVFGVNDQYSMQLIAPDEKIKEKKYQDFVLKEYALDENHTIYFYFMTYIPEPDNISLLNQIIPKAPFTFFLLDSKVGLQDEAIKNLFNNYSEKYSTPVFVIVNRDSLEPLSKIESDPLIEANNFEVILVDEDSQQITQTVIIEAIKRAMPANV